MAESIAGSQRSCRRIFVWYSRQKVHEHHYVLRNDFIYCQPCHTAICRAIYNRTYSILPVGRLFRSIFHGFFYGNCPLHKNDRTLGGTRQNRQQPCCGCDIGRLACDFKFRQQYSDYNNRAASFRSYEYSRNNLYKQPKRVFREA